jgi:rhodanese-related sulfurtransferase
VPTDLKRMLVPAVLAVGLGWFTFRPSASPAAPSPDADPSTTPPGVVHVITARALARHGARLVDVRTPGEYAAGHAEGAVNIPHDEIAKRAAELGGPETPVVLYCRSGRRSGIAAQALRDLGFKKVFDFQRYDDWASSR